MGRGRRTWTAASGDAGRQSSIPVETWEREGARCEREAREEEERGKEAALSIPSGIKAGGGALAGWLVAQDEEVGWLDGSGGDPDVERTRGVAARWNGKDGTGSLDPRVGPIYIASGFWFRGIRSLRS